MLTETQTLRELPSCIEDVMRYIRAHINEPLNRETLAAVAGFSVPHFHRVFTAHVGESAASYVRRLRLNAPGANCGWVPWISRRSRWHAGYDTHAAFSKAFKQRLDSSPSEFRQLAVRVATQLLTERKIRMKIKLTSVSIDDYDKALKFYTEVLGFLKKRDIPLGEGARLDHRGFA